MKSTADDISKLQGQVAPLLDAAAPEGLLFTNEMYVLRHLLTQAKYKALRLVEDHSDSQEVPAEEVEELRDLVGAAKLTIDAAEALLPASQTQISGERFWDRFTRVSDERQVVARRQRDRDLGR